MNLLTVKVSTLKGCIIKSAALLFITCIYILIPAKVNAQSVFEKQGITFEVITYIRKGVEKDSRGDYPVIYVDKIDSRVVSANYSLGGKTYTLNSFNGRLKSAFSEVKVTEMRVIGSLADGSMKIDACFESNSKHGSNITNIKKGTTPNIVHKVNNICEISGIDELNDAIRELEDEEKQKQAAKQEQQENVAQQPSRQNPTQKPTSSNTTSNQSTTSRRPASTTANTPDYQAQWNRQVAQDRQNYNRAIDNFSNTLSQYSQNLREERLAEQERKERKEIEAYNRQINLLNKANGRRAIVADFPAKDVPLGSQEKSAQLYYFVYAYKNLSDDHPVVFVSNVFEIGKYADGTRAYTTTIKAEIESLTPHAEVLHGYYYSQEEAQEALNDFKEGLRANDALISNINYKGKPSTANAASRVNSKDEKIIGAPATIDPRPTSGVAPNNKVDKAINNKDEKIIN